MYFDIRRALTHNCALNFITSVRGLGKTYSALDFCMRASIERGEEFVYVRRNDLELQKVKARLFNNHPFDGVEIYGNEIKQTKELRGYVIPLSLANQFKSNAFPNVRTLVFDEYISETDQYLKDEVQKFLSLIETIFRTRPIRVICLGNNITSFNPYSVFFGIPFQHDGKIWKDRKRSILYLEPDAAEFREMKSQTAFGRLIAGTEYGDFIMENRPVMDSYDQVVGKENGRDELCFLFDGRYFTLSRNRKRYHLRQTAGRTQGVEFFNLTENIISNACKVPRTKGPVRILSHAVANAELVFDSLGTKKYAEILLK